MKIIVDLAGGFGNQLFCYSFGYALSKTKNAELIIDTTSQDNGIARELELLELKVKYDSRISYKYVRSFIDRAVINKLRKKKAIGYSTKIYYETYPTIFEDAVFEVQEDTYFKGNWQSDKYFSNYREDLLKMLVPKENRDETIRNIYENMANSNSVAIHVRRGDYIEIGCQLDMNYYDKAISLIQSKYSGEKLIFYVFSDDIEFCKDYFSNNRNENIEFQYPTYKSDNYTLDDLFLMCHCKNMIMANSSYSWWAAWLNQNKDKIVICPSIGMWKGDFYPEEWTQIPC